MSGAVGFPVRTILSRATLAVGLVALAASGVGCGARETDAERHDGSLPGQSAQSPPPATEMVGGIGQQTPDRPPGRVATEEDSRSQTPPTPLPRPAETTPATPKTTKPAADSPLTRESLDAIAEGMTVDEVSALVGQPGVTIASREDSVVLHRWSTEEQSFLAKFEDGKLTRKTMMSTIAEDESESTPETELTEDTYDRVQPGMSLEEVLSLLEIPGHPVAHQGEELVIYRWSDDQGSSFTARFEDHRLVRKTAFVVAPKAATEGESADDGTTPQDAPPVGEGEGEGAPEGEGAVIEVQIAEAPVGQETPQGRPNQPPRAQEQQPVVQEAPRQVRVIGSTRRERELEADDSPYAGSSYKPRPKLPEYTWSLSKGAYEIQVKNPTDDAVEVGIRQGNWGRDLTVRPNDTASIFVDQGDYQIHYRYKDNPYAIYRGGLIRIDGAYTADVEVTLIEENYSVRHLQDDGGFRRRP